jgi:hypothetical protein
MRLKDLNECLPILVIPDLKQLSDRTPAHRERIIEKGRDDGIRIGKGRKTDI